MPEIGNFIRPNLKKFLKIPKSYKYFISTYIPKGAPLDTGSFAEVSYKKDKVKIYGVSSAAPIGGGVGAASILSPPSGEMPNAVRQRGSSTKLLTLDYCIIRA